jgi:SAM-dependent methyltransferase
MADQGVYAALNREKAAIKEAVRAHWEAEPCESRAGKGASTREAFFRAIDAYRYEKSPFVAGFAKFEQSRGQKVLEVGLGSGSDFVRFARNGALLWGVDPTEASVNLINDRLAAESLKAVVRVGDVEALDFGDEFFDIVYSYGVIHHTPDTPAAVRELYRVLKKGGVARIMIYHVGGLTWYYQWILFGLLKRQPRRSLREIAFYHNESIGTKLYSRSEARELFAPFRSVSIPEARARAQGGAALPSIALRNHDADRGGKVAPLSATAL